MYDPNVEMLGVVSLEQCSHEKALAKGISIKRRR